MRLSKVVCVLMANLALTQISCNLDHLDAEPYWKKQREEAAIANRKLPELTEDGKIPVVAAPEVAAASAQVADTGQKVSAEAEAKFTTICANCHGADGMANTPTGAALTPKPRSFTDKAWQKSVTDEHIALVIKNGGASVGLSPLMAPFGAMLSEDEVKGLVAKIRGFAQ